MANNPTIISASLNDKELRDSIDKLVKHVEDGTQRMAKSMDDAVERMKKSLQSLGNINVNMGGASDGGASRRTKKNVEEEKSVKNTTVAYDKLADAQEKIAKNSLRQSYARAQKIQTEDYDMAITKLERIQSLLNANRNIPFMSPSQVAASEQEVRRLSNAIRQMAADRQAAMQRSAEAERQAATNAAKYADEVIRAAQAIRSSQEWQKNGYYTLDTSSYRAKLYNNSIPLEQQLTELLQTQGTITEQIKKNVDGTNNTVKQVSTSTENIANQSQRIKDNWSVNTFTVALESANRLKDRLKELRSLYANMTFGERMSERGQKIAQEIREITRQTQKLDKELSRPTKKEIAGLNPKTLDELAYKIQMLTRYQQGIRIIDDKGKKEIQDVSKEIDALKRKQQELLGSNKTLLESNNALARSWNYMKNRLAFYFTVGASTQFVKQLIDVRGQYEMLERSIGILFDSMQTGTKIFSELNAMAIKSPFTTMELGAAAKQLSAYNIAAKDVVDTTRRLADIAAAVGVPIERLTYALGQIKSYGYLNSRDARMFANAGIPLIQNLADMYTKLEGRLVSIGDVYDRIKKKQISFEDTISVINEMTNKGGRFFNFQEKAADTLKVQLANLTLAWNNFLNEFGKARQGWLSGGMRTIKSLLESWRSLNNILLAVATAFGVVKVAQILYVSWANKVGIATAAADVASSKLVGKLYAVKAAMMSLVSSPIAWATAIGTALMYLVYKYADLQAANEAFNKTLSDNAKENIESIDKFVKEYGKDIESVGSLSVTDQAKLWERVREEIEKTSKNAKAYIELLESIPDIANRVIKASSYFEQEKIIQGEVKRLADKGYFSVGGGFGDDSAAKDLKQYSDTLNEIIREYGTLKDFLDYVGENPDWNGLYTTFKQRSAEAMLEVNKFINTLDNAGVSFDRIFGNGSNSEKLANLENFKNQIRDAFLATEEGQKIGIEGQQVLNSALDRWVSNIALANNVIDNETASILNNRTAWEKFFSFLTDNDKKTLDYLIKTGNVTSDTIKEIWENAAKELKKTSHTAFSEIENQIANLRDTPPIVIRLIYRQEIEKLDEQQKAFVDKWITPKYSSVIPADEYLEQETANRTKYGRLMRKQDEDNVEWEKRLGEEYVANAKNIENLNKQLENSAKMSKADVAQKTRERDLFVDLNSALKDIEQSQGFDFSQFEKGSKGGKENADELAKALSNETKLVNKLTTAFDKLAKAGMSSGEAMRVVRNQFGGSIAQINSVLNKFGLQGLDISIIQGKDPNAILKYFSNIKKQLEDKGLSNLKRLEPVEAIIESVEVSARTYNLDKITKGLNNELGKLKDEYELAVELEANPELGNMFAGMFGVDTSALSSDIYEYADHIQQIVNKAMLDARENNPYDFVPFDLLTDDINEWAAKTGVDLNSELAKSIIAGQKQVRSAYKSYFTEIDKQTKDLQYKLADTDGKIAIEEEKLARLQQRLANETHEEKRRLLALEIQEQQQAINKLKEELLQLLPTYKALFGGVAEHSAYMTRKIARQMQDMLNNAERNQDGSYTVTDPRSGQKATMSATTYANLNKKVNEEIKKSATPLSKIKEAFTKGEDGVTDWAKGIEYLGEELQKMSTLVNEIGNFAVALGLDEDTAAEIKSVADTIAGVSTAIDGFTKIAAGDYIGGTASILSGATSVISSWLNNKNEKINRQIEKSEIVVKRLENAYKSLSDAVENAYGIAEVGAQRVAIANKKLQLAELKRQLQLEKSRDAKDRDKSKIADLEGQIIDLELEIKNATNDIVNDLLGISSVGSAAESLVSSMIESFKKGEDYMGVFADSFEDMIDNMIMKAIVSQVIGDRLQELFDKIKTNKEGKKDQYGYTADMYEEEIAAWEKTLQAYKLSGKTEAAKAAEEYIARMKKLQEALLRVTPEDIRESESMIEGWKNDVKSEFEAYMAAFGIKYGEGADKNLSALQQGIQGITEDTAGAIEAYMNIVSQKVFEQNEYLLQIRDYIAAFDFDVQLSVMSQILMQLQASYQAQMAIQSTLAGWSNATGMAVRVEMI